MADQDLFGTVGGAGQQPEALRPIEGPQKARPSASIHASTNLPPVAEQTNEVAQKKLATREKELEVFRKAFQHAVSESFLGSIINKITALFSSFLQKVAPPKADTYAVKTAPKTLTEAVAQGNQEVKRHLITEGPEKVLNRKEFKKLANELFQGDTKRLGRFLKEALLEAPAVEVSKWAAFLQGQAAKQFDGAYQIGNSLESVAGTIEANMQLMDEKTRLSHELLSIAASRQMGDKELGSMKIAKEFQTRCLQKLEDQMRIASHHLELYTSKEKEVDIYRPAFQQILSRVDAEMQAVKQWDLSRLQQAFTLGDKSHG